MLKGRESSVQDVYVQPLASVDGTLIIQSNREQMGVYNALKPSAVLKKVAEMQFNLRLLEITFPVNPFLQCADKLTL